MGSHRYGVELQCIRQQGYKVEYRLVVFALYATIPHVKDHLGEVDEEMNWILGVSQCGQLLEYYGREGAGRIGWKGVPREEVECQRLAVERAVIKDQLEKLRNVSREVFLRKMMLE